MAKPAAVQKLRHGKALCGATFGQFVETFNWLVDFCLNLQGDKNANNANGTITVDRADPSAPVIRWARVNLGFTPAAGAWQYDADAGKLVNCYYNAAGVTGKVADVEYTPTGSGILCAKFNIFASGVSFESLELANDLSNLNGMQNNSYNYIVPLYLVEDDEIVADIRNAPQLQIFEGFS